MENYLNQENFNSTQGVTFGEYPTSSKAQDFLGDIQTSSQFNQQFTGATNILSSSTEASALESLSGNMGIAQYVSSNETLPTINAANDYEVLGTNKSEVSLEQYQSMNTNITNLADTTNNTQDLPAEYLSLMTQNINSDKQVQNMGIFPSSNSSEVLNTFQTSSSNYDNISLGNFQIPTVDTNSNNFGQVENAPQGTNQGEIFNFPTEYSSLMAQNIIVTNKFKIWAYFLHQVSEVLNTFQTSSSNYDNISLGNFQIPTVDTNSNNWES
jgi:hypothetical protein